MRVDGGSAERAGARAQPARKGARRSGAGCLDHHRPIHDERRWNVTRRLLHDDTVTPEGRFAGLLLLLYAQGAWAISLLTTEDVEVGSREVRLVGADSFEPPTSAL
ncbi:hypothetical protein OG209_28675 [Streptomyces sp. NBC_01383]|uniref:hypothetical protein n=1 Tax=Streptomyces sp. NBC_01383 TaxID=2903846 RepID=UPI003255BDDE